MNSPYLDQSRPTRKLIEELIAAREAELAKGTEDTTTAPRTGLDLSSRGVGPDRRFRARTGNRLQSDVSDESARKR